MSRSFDQLSNDTLVKMKGFGTKNRDVLKKFKQACRELNAYLKENNLVFSFENGQKWLSEMMPQQPMSYYQHLMTKARRRAVFLLSECQAGTLDSWLCE